MSFTLAGNLKEIPVGGMRATGLDGESVLLCRLEDGQVFAVENACSHDGSPLDDGSLDGVQLTCCHHGATFDVTSGAALKMPAIQALESFPVRLSGDDVLVDLED